MRKGNWRPRQDATGKAWTAELCVLHVQLLAGLYVEGMGFQTLRSSSSLYSFPPHSFAKPCLWDMPFTHAHAHPLTTWLTPSLPQISIRSEPPTILWPAHTLFTLYWMARTYHHTWPIVNAQYFPNWNNENYISRHWTKGGEGKLERIKGGWTSPWSPQIPWQNSLGKGRMGE